MGSAGILNSGAKGLKASKHIPLRNNRTSKLPVFVFFLFFDTCNSRMKGAIGALLIRTKLLESFRAVFFYRNGSQSDNIKTFEAHSDRALQSPHQPSPHVTCPHKPTLTFGPCACAVSLLSTGANIPLAQVVVVTSCNLHWWCFFIQSLAQIVACTRDGITLCALH